MNDVLKQRIEELEDEIDDLELELSFKRCDVDSLEEDLYQANKQIEKLKKYSDAVNKLVKVMIETGLFVGSDDSIDSVLGQLKWQIRQLKKFGVAGLKRTA